MGRTGCCTKPYTTRAYNPANGDIFWSANYFGSQTTGAVYTQAVDSARVYVAGSRVTSGGSNWTLMCLDIGDGAVLWTRDVANDISLASVNVIQLRIAPSGNVVCMMLPVTHFISAGVADLVTVYFVEVDTTGALVATRNFKICPSGTPPAGQVAGGDVPKNFTINENGDYHVCGLRSSGFEQDVILWDWLSPFSSLPTLRHAVGTYSGSQGINKIISYNIDRYNGRDIVAGSAQHSVQTFPGGVFYQVPGPSIVVGKSQTACWGNPTDSWSDIDCSWMNFDLEYNQYTVGLGYTCNKIPAGSTQGTATALAVGDVNGPFSWTAGTGWILPSGSSVGDQIAIEGLTAFSGFGKIGDHSGVNMYPPSGGTIDGLAANAPIEVIYGDIFTCLGGDNWIRQNINTGETHISTGMNSSHLAACGSDGSVRFFNSSARAIWKVKGKNCTVCLDSSSDVFSAGRYTSAATVIARDLHGKYLWGHRHMQQHDAFDAVTSTNTIQMDPDGSAVICSGNGTFGPALRPNDVDYLQNPFAPYKGRTATASDDGSHSTYSVGMSGGAVANGDGILAIMSSEGTDAVFSSMTGWKQLGGKTSGGVGHPSGTSLALYFRIASSEPTSYSVVSGGRGSCVKLMEIKGMGPDNPIAVASVRNGSSSPAISIPNPDALVIIAFADGNATSGFGVPAGFTSDGTAGYSPENLFVGMAHADGAGSGTFAPGAYTSPETTDNYLYTVAFGPP